MNTAGEGSLKQHGLGKIHKLTMKKRKFQMHNLERVGKHLGAILEPVN